MKFIVGFLELFYFSIYDWLKNNASNWYVGPIGISTDLIFLSLLGNCFLILVKINLSHSILTFLLSFFLFIFYIYITFHYNEERFELIEERYEQLNKAQKIIIKNIAFVYLILSFYSFYSAISLSS